ncbi:hypothetical protein RMSM_04823 [Rhodopirellula maiorica SM1]|uniref:Uncharacterized protein n=1 Tax=Rhodopirellula maiorica SM1 TaxID=1265738 RepID=M5RSA6_9BACT|nr:hypothetical protein RMSM_04823 [Rhodopirellula maiorica SM1]
MEGREITRHKKSMNAKLRPRVVNRKIENCGSATVADSPSHFETVNRSRAQDATNIAKPESSVGPVR